MATSYEASRAQPRLVFPLSGPPVCVDFGFQSNPGCIRSVYKERMGANFIEISDVSGHAKTQAGKFILEPSKQHEGLLHVRCCDSNKYWVAQQRVHDGSAAAWFICGEADEPEEDLGKPSCTLFDLRPAAAYPDVEVRFFHSQQKKYVSVISGGDKTYMKLQDDLEEENSLVDYIFNSFRVRRLSLQKELPRYVAFKGNNGKYLALKYPYVQFSSSGITDRAVIHETFTDEYGIVRIRSHESHRFWRLGAAGWISADLDDPAYTVSNDVYNDVNALFKVVIKHDNCIALQSISNGRFCKRLTDDDKIECLSACVNDYSSIEETELVIEEPVKSRDIYDVVYRLGAAKKRGTERQLSQTIMVAVNTTNETHYAKTALDLYQRTESRWDASATLDVGIKANLEASVPIDSVEASVERGSHTEVHGEYNWGKAKIEKVNINTEYSCHVPPKTRVVCSLFATEEIIDAPFSYKRKDVLVSGEVLPARELHDGIYHGVKTNEINIVASEEKAE